MWLLEASPQTPTGALDSTRGLPSARSPYPPGHLITLYTVKDAMKGDRLIITDNDDVINYVTSSYHYYSLPLLSPDAAT